MRIIRFLKRAEKDLLDLPVVDRATIVAAVEALGRGAPNADVKKLRGVVNQYRLRVGRFRVLFTVVENGTIIVGRVADRGSAY